ncbi:DUF1064 domain-containing protein [Paraburkholderia sediminicola]|uniref:DUF1064 domain-containing protein n=1 Tax=Paraburkholderia sediminicola TaxID=458836 RepID=UPI0038BA62D6
MSVLRFTPEQYEAHLSRLKAAVPVPVVEVSPKAAEPAAARERVRALGRLKTGEMNKTEAAYEKALADRKHAGEIVWYAFEAITFVLPGGVRYTPDFVVQLATGEIEIHEVKGYWEEDARQKIKIAQGAFPFRFIGIRKRPKKEGGGWDIEDFWKW